MNEERLDKMAIRELWADAIEECLESFGIEDEPVYMTLTGAQAKDIQVLIDRGIIRLAENRRSILPEDENMVVAVESNASAILSIQSKVPGLRIRDRNVGDIVSGTGPYAWPGPDDVRHCRARVVNLDLEGPLIGNSVNGRIEFRITRWIEKICRLHEKYPSKDWVLCLTLNASLEWPAEVSDWAKRFLMENFSRDADFKESCRRFLGDSLIGELIGERPMDFAELGSSIQQRLLMVLVPKMIAHGVHAEGWNIKTVRNLSYGGGDVAYMVTWIIRFTRQPEATAAPDSLYRAALRGILQDTGFVARDGTINSETFCE